MMSVRRTQRPPVPRLVVSNPQPEAPAWHKLTMNALRTRLEKEKGTVTLFVCGPGKQRVPLHIPPTDGMHPTLSALRARENVSTDVIAFRTGWSESALRAKTQAGNSNAARLSFGDMTRYLGALGLWLEGELSHPEEDRQEAIHWAQLPDATVVTWQPKRLSLRDPAGLPMATPPHRMLSWGELRADELGKAAEAIQLTPRRSSEHLVEMIEGGSRQVPLRTVLEYVQQLKNGKARSSLELHAVDGFMNRVALKFSGTGAKQAVTLRQIREHLGMSDAVFHSLLKQKASPLRFEQLEGGLADGSATFYQLEEGLRAMGSRPQWVVGWPQAGVGIRL